LVQIGLPVYHITLENRMELHPNRSNTLWKWGLQEINQQQQPTMIIGSYGQRWQGRPPWSCHDAWSQETDCVRWIGGATTATRWCSHSFFFTKKTGDLTWFNHPPGGVIVDLC
jgi:hypothetical protein